MSEQYIPTLNKWDLRFGRGGSRRWIRHNYLLIWELMLRVIRWVLADDVAAEG